MRPPETEPSAVKGSPAPPAGSVAYHIRTLLLALAVSCTVLAGRVLWLRVSTHFLEPLPPPFTDAPPTNMVEVTVDPTQKWESYLNVYHGIPGKVAPQGIGVSPTEVNAGFVGDRAFLGPVRSHPLDRNPRDTNWWSPDGVGRKQLQSFLHVNHDGLAGKTVVFTGHCLSNDLPKKPGYLARAVISDFPPDFKDTHHVTAKLRPGKRFALSLRTRPGNHIRYGFELVGPNLDQARFGPVGHIWLTGQVQPESPPEPVPRHFDNPSFERLSFRNPPGYVADNGGTIPGWTVSDPASIGLDTQGGWFANNGAVPNGRQVAFLRTRDGHAGTLATELTGLEPGKAYQVGFRANSRADGAETHASWSLNGGDFVAFKSWPPVGVSNAFHMISGGFLATGTNATLVIRNQSATDSALLVDDFVVVFVPGIPRDMSQRKGDKPALPPDAGGETP